MPKKGRARALAPTTTTGFTGQKHLPLCPALSHTPTLLLKLHIIWKRKGILHWRRGREGSWEGLCDRMWSLGKGKP